VDPRVITLECAVHGVSVDSGSDKWVLGLVGAACRRIDRPSGGGEANGSCRVEDSYDTWCLKLGDKPYTDCGARGMGAAEQVQRTLYGWAALWNGLTDKCRREEHMSSKGITSGILKSLGILGLHQLVSKIDVVALKVVSEFV
jgi:hypothetical protein